MAGGTSCVSVPATAFVAYLVAGVLAQPDWHAAARGLVVPSVPGDRAGLLAVVAAIGQGCRFSRAERAARHDRRR